ncbi:transcriptional regulator [Levilactobacillus paucivorans]|uniref:Transcriptional regulator n=1 Tax=Levilactobacillus paucivorans TaxID=616990 RepID=A0A0R2LU32_9LACO|nr:MerR family transcriptional regulator [Levilactobacillus paucivorans]KRO04694.1 transcriptional regulator [Levilactobacillus paucivorans]
MTYTIHEVAEKLGISTYSIRYYNDHGMLPFVQRDANNNRIFHDTDLEWLSMIVCLRETGMSVKAIKHYQDLIQEGDDTINERYAMMCAQQEQTLAEIADLKKHLDTINYKVAHYASILENNEPDSFVPSNLRTEAVGK